MGLHNERKEYLEKCVKMVKPGGYLFLSMLGEKSIDGGGELPSGWEDQDTMMKYEDAEVIIRK